MDNFDYKQMITEGFSQLEPTVTADDIISAKAAAKPRRSGKKLWIALGAAAAAAAAAFFVMIGIGYDKMGTHGNSNIAVGEDTFLPQLLNGRYYLNGDVSTGLYAEVTDGELQFCGDREWYVQQALEWDLSFMERELTEEELAQQLEFEYKYVDNLMMARTPVKIFDNRVSEHDVVNGDISFIVDGKQYYMLFHGNQVLRFDGDRTITVNGALRQEELDKCATAEERERRRRGMADFILADE